MDDLPAGYRERAGVSRQASQAIARAQAFACRACRVVVSIRKWRDGRVRRWYAQAGRRVT
jgi:hypothetical protein